MDTNENKQTVDSSQVQDPKAVAAAAKAAKKAEDDKVKAAAKAAKEAAKEEKKQAAAAAKAKREEDKKQAKEAAEAAKKANQMPMQNGVRRPKPDGLCGKAWAVFDDVTAKGGTYASIGESMKRTRELGLNDANVRAEYARWRKFHGVTGRIDAPKPPVAPTTEVAPPPPPVASASE